jgi:hypothetical protein
MMDIVLKWVNEEPSFRRFQLMCNPSKVNCWSMRVWSTYEDGAMRQSPGFGYGITIGDAFHEAMMDRANKSYAEKKVL